MPKKGIDVSYANGPINWSKAKSDVEFAIIRSSFGSDLPSQTDNYFFQNATGCVKNNVPFGIYHFAYFVDTDTAVAEADFAIRLANEYAEHVRFIALDIEEDSERYANRVGKYPNWTECAVVFLERIKKAGFTPVLYSNQNWLLNKLNYEKLRPYKLWYAAPGASAPKYECAIWQNSWTGRINGINGDVDMNVCYDDSLFNASVKTAAAKKKEYSGISQLTSSIDVDYTVRVIATNGVNIRKGAATSFAKIGAVPFGTQLEVTRQANGGNYRWGLITYQGVTGWIVLDFTEKVVVAVKKGSKVRVKPGATVYGTQTPLSSWVYSCAFTVMEVAGDRVVIGMDGNVTSAVDIKDLTLSG